MKKGLFLMMALLFNAVMGATISAAIGLPAIVGAVGLPAVSTLSPLFGIEGLRAGLYTEVWTGEMIKAFRNSVESIGWLNKIRSYDQYADKDVIHFVDIGIDPEVLINNTTYPIPVQNLTDGDKSISLDKYQTKPTRITDDELRAISYDKIGSVIERHRESIDEKKIAKALHAIAPSTDSNATPIIRTSGEAATGEPRKIFTRKDIVALKKKFDAAKVPVTGRILVLCPDHVNDLLLNDQKFADQYYSYQSGKIANIHSFEVYEYVDAPYYDSNTGTKLPWGGVPTPTHFQASVAFHEKRVMKATGSTKTYMSKAEDNPETQENLVNFRHYFICLPLKNEAIGAIISNKS